jgi:hypothetical protein
MTWTRPRCQLALKVFATEAPMHWCASGMTSFTPHRPRRASLRRSATQNGSTAERPMFMPSTPAG